MPVAMLNQNYTVIGKQKNCRVALGIAHPLSVAISSLFLFFF